MDRRVADLNDKRHRFQPAIIGQVGWHSIRFALSNHPLRFS
jgi:hypothetical protein